jgi:flavin reductase (DIM6/NTAB) family NADH-FMN oxidoreductase RutF
VALECTLHSTIRLGDCVLVLGRVVHAAVDEDVLDGAHPVIERLRPLSRLGRNQWGAPPQPREINRIPHAQWPGHFRGSGGGDDTGGQ